MAGQSTRAIAQHVWRLNGPWIVLVVAYWVFAVLQHAVLGRPSPLLLMPGALAAGGSSAVIWATVFLTILLAKRRGPSPFQDIVAAVKTPDFIQRAASVLSVATLVFLFQFAFVSVKRTIPMVHPFDLDPLLARMDEVIHGGPAWKLVEPIVGFPVAAKFIDLAYTAWLPIMITVPVLMSAWFERPKLRAQFLLSFFLIWILLGNVLAVMLSSVGPCFYDFFYSGPDPFADKLALLKEMGERIPLDALALQEIALKSVASDDHGDWYAISAMPSLHVAVATLLLITGFKINRWVGVAGALFFATILVGSVYLAWHYALDGYVSIISVVLIWKLSGWLLSSVAMHRTRRLQPAPAFGR